MGARKPLQGGAVGGLVGCSLSPLIVDVIPPGPWAAVLGAYLGALEGAAAAGAGSGGDPNGILVGAITGTYGGAIGGLFGGGAGAVLGATFAIGAEAQYGFLSNILR